MDRNEILDWWENFDGIGDEEEYAHHPSDVIQTQWGTGIILCLPYLNLYPAAFTYCYLYP